MAALRIENPLGRFQHDTSALHRVEPYNFFTPGGLIVPTYPTQIDRLPRRQRSGRQRPLTFHGGCSSHQTANDWWPPESVLDQYAPDDAHTISHVSRPTIASIKCDDPTNLADLEPEPPTSPTIPDLRLDTSCATTTSIASPLALASNFLETLAGLIHSPSTPSKPQRWTTDQAILIFESDILIEVSQAPVEDRSLDDVFEPSSPPWDISMEEWKLRMASLDEDLRYMEPSLGPDPAANAKHSEAYLDAPDLIWC